MVCWAMSFDTGYPSDMAHYMYYLFLGYIFIGTPGGHIYCYTYEPCFYVAMQHCKYNSCSVHYSMLCLICIGFPLLRLLFCQFDTISNNHY